MLFLQIALITRFCREHVKVTLDALLMARVNI